MMINDQPPPAIFRTFEDCWCYRWRHIHGPRRHVHGPHQHHHWPLCDEGGGGNGGGSGGEGGVERQGVGVTGVAEQQGGRISGAGSGLGAGQVGEEAAAASNTTAIPMSAIGSGIEGWAMIAMVVIALRLSRSISSRR
jgi:hypothetical protein